MYKRDLYKRRRVIIFYAACACAGLCLEVDHTLRCLSGHEVAASVRLCCPRLTDTGRNDGFNWISVRAILPVGRLCCPLLSDVARKEGFDRTSVRVIVPVG